MPRKHKDNTPLLQPTPPPPKQPTIQSNTPSMLSNLKDSILSGFGFGMGSSIAHKVSDSVFSSSSSTTPSSNSTPTFNRKIDCNQIQSDLDKCTEDCAIIYNTYSNNCNKIDPEIK